MDLYKNTNTVLPKGVNIEDIPEIYSKKVAGLPIDFTTDLNVRGQYSRIPVSIPEFLGKGSAHGAIDREIRIDSTLETGWGDMKSPDVSILRNWKNTLLHEAFGHALPESIFGYKPKGTKGSVLSGRSEMLPYLLQSISSVGKTNKELFGEKYPTLPLGSQFKEPQQVIDYAIKNLEPIVQNLLKDMNK